MIRAWRELKPLREAALLHQIATTLESHITEFIEETESQQVESQKIFDATVSDLSERLANLEGELEEREASLQTMAEGQTSLTDQIEDSQRSLEVPKVTNAQLFTENDGLRGQFERFEGEHKETIATLNVDARESAKVYAFERSRASTEHAAVKVGGYRSYSVTAHLPEEVCKVVETPLCGHL